MAAKYPIAKTNAPTTTGADNDIIDGGDFKTNINADNSKDKFDRNNSSLTEISTKREFPKQLDLAQVCIYGLSILSVGIFLFLPFVNLLHPSPWQRSIGTIHSFGSLIAIVVAVYTGHLAFPLLRGSAKVLPQVRTLIFWTTSAAFLAITTGNWAYMRFSADLEFGGGRAWLKENSPLVPSVLSNYHKFSGLFILPMGVACAWILWTYGDAILDKKYRVVLSATCVALMALMFFAMGGLVTGLGMAKIHAL